MNFFKRIAGHIYFFYGMIIFIITLLLIAFIPTLIALQLPEPKRAKRIHKIYRFWMGVVLPLVFIRVVRSGKENFKQGATYVVVFNHNSLVDIIVSTPWTPGANKTLAKIEMAKIPVFGTIYRAGSILVDRSSDGSRKQSFIEMQNTLKLGLHLILYPEGTRNKTNEPLGEFKDGAFVTAIRAQKSIIPGLLFNTRKILPNKPKLWAFPYKIKIDFLPAVATAGLSLREADALKETVHKIMYDYIVQHL